MRFVNDHDPIPLAQIQLQARYGEKVTIEYLHRDTDGVGDRLRAPVATTGRSRCVTEVTDVAGQKSSSMEALSSNAERPWNLMSAASTAVIRQSQRVWSW